MDVTPIGYSQYVEVNLGFVKMVILSGQAAVDAQGNTVGSGDFEKQVDQIFLSTKEIMEKAGGTIDNIVKLTSYLTDISNLQLFRNVRDRHINTSQPPASSAVEVSKLFRDDILIEIEVVAIMKNSYFEDILILPKESLQRNRWC